MLGNSCCIKRLKKNCEALNSLADQSEEILALVTPPPLPVFDDDLAAIAGGLASGDQYITPDGVVHQVL